MSLIVPKFHIATSQIIGTDEYLVVVENVINPFVSVQKSSQYNLVSFYPKAHACAKLVRVKPLKAATVDVRLDQNLTTFDSDCCNNWPHMICQ